MLAGHHYFEVLERWRREKMARSVGLAGFALWCRSLLFPQSPRNDRSLRGAAKSMNGKAPNDASFADRFAGLVLAGFAPCGPLAALESRALRRFHPGFHSLGIADARELADGVEQHQHHWRWAICPASPRSDRPHG